MKSGAKNLKITAIVAAATMGSGVFALPYVMARAGWLLAIFYFLMFAVVVTAAHVVYLRTLETVNEKERLLGLAKKYLGSAGFWIGFVAIVIGLLLSFTAYLIIGPEFVRLAAPAAPPALALAFFWLLVSVPVFFGDSGAVNMEEIGVSLIACVIIFVFASGHPSHAFAILPIADFHYLFLPVGAILFSLAGWTSIELVYGVRKKTKNSASAWMPFLTGSLLAALLYFLFALGISGSAARITENTISGLLNWPFWKKDIVAIIGLLAVWTASVPVSREIRNALEKDLGWPPVIARAVILGVPLIVVVSGFNDFFAVISIAGGLFLSTQYLLILGVGARVLKFSRLEKIVFSAAAAVFVSAAVYSIYSFIVK
jgi:amino acid permease